LAGRQYRRQRPRKEVSVLYPTKNDLSREIRNKVTATLNERLADAIDLQTQCKQAHWNVKGPSFTALHELFDKINGDVEDYVDLLAERIVQLGGMADGTARSIAKRTTLPEYGARGADGCEHVQALSTALAAFGGLARAGIARSDELGDADTADIFTEISRGTDKWLWMVEAHVGADR
jgi:starvation-inducible DNA-binding protein